MPTKTRKPPQLTPKFVADALHLTLRKHKENLEPFTAVVTDSRKIVPGALFVAIKGDKFDGHDFIPDAISQGVQGILCRKGSIGSHTRVHDVCVYEVEDTQEAYRQLAAVWRNHFSIPMIAIAGSMGKTTTKELLAAILKGKWPTQVLKTSGSQNGFLGIPMTLLELRPEHKAAVVEVGIDEIGAMEKHLPIVAPTASLVTAIGPEHLEKLMDLETVAREEKLALTYVDTNNGITVLNLDDPWLAPLATSLKGPKGIGFTLGEKASQKTLCGQLSTDETVLTVSGLGLSKKDFDLPLPGRHNAQNLLGAIGMALVHGLKPDEIRDGLKTFKGAEGRSQIRTLPGGHRVLCDYYNANPPSMAAGLELLATQSHGRKWACLGDMLELGSQEEGFHRELATLIVQKEIDRVLLFGPRMKWLFDELKHRAFKGHVSHFTTHFDLAQALFQGVSPGDSILIKGSRSMKMEEVWKHLETYANTHWK